MTFMKLAAVHPAAKMYAEEVRAGLGPGLPLRAVQPLRGEVQVHDPAGADGRAVLFTVQERGASHLYRLPTTGGKPEMVVGELGTIGATPAVVNAVVDALARAGARLTAARAPATRPARRGFPAASGRR